MFEVACGNCQGRLLVQQTGVVVACPHCGTHLTIGGPVPAPPPPAPVQNFVPQPPQVIAPPPQAWTPPPAPVMAPPPQPVALQLAPVPQPVQPVAPVSPPPVFVQPQVPQFQAPAEPEPAAPSWFSPPAAEEPAPVVGEAMPFLGDVQATVPAVNQIDAASAPPAFDATIAAAPAFATTTPQVALEPVAAVPTPAVAPPDFFAVPAQPITPVPQPVAPPQWAAPNSGMEYSMATQVAPAPIAAAPVAYPQPFQQPVAPEPVAQLAYAAQPMQVPQPASQPVPQQAGWYQAPEQQPQAFGQPAYGVPDAQPVMSMPGSDAVAQDWSSAPSSLPPAPTPLPITASGVSRGKFMLLANYASIATILAAFFAYKAFVAGSASGNDPANLPDVEPKKVGKQIGAVVVEPFRNLDGGQKLTLGETKRFGNLNVTPLSIERGEIEFERLQGVASGLQKPSENVLMLHVKFENVSEDQEIAPLRSLVYKQQGTAFVCVESQRAKKGFKLLHAKLDKEPWRVKGHNIDKTLMPGETLETFIPTASKDVDKLLDDEGEKVWRLWFRKGYSRNNYGVTTLVDIAFNNSDVKS